MQRQMKQWRVLAVWVLLGGVIGAPAAPQARAQGGEAYQWTYSARPGEVQRFRTYIRITGRMPDDSEDLKITLKSASRHDIRQVSPEGNVTYDQSDERFAAVINDEAVAAKSAEVKPVSLTVGRNGLVLARTNPAINPLTQRYDKSLIALQSMPVPPKPVKVGESWTVPIPNPLLKSGIIQTTSTLVGVETVGGRPAFRVQLRMEFPTTFGATEQEIVKAQVIYFLDRETHQLLRASYTVQNPMLPFPGLRVQSQALVFRVIPGVNDAGDPEGDKLLAEKP